jgi:very-short-patch-repair endonuclease
MQSRANIARARVLRATLTPPELRLWPFLKSLRAEGHHFRRQSPFRGYILDFVCYASRLVVEVDGAHHATEPQRHHDEIRDSVLARENFQSIRLPASEILTNFESATTAIRAALKGNTPPLTRPPLYGEGQARSGQGGAGQKTPACPNPLNKTP